MLEPVVEMDIAAALAKYQPTIGTHTFVVDISTLISWGCFCCFCCLPVICNWCPSNVDLTAEFRKCPSVQEVRFVFFLAVIVCVRVCTCVCYVCLCLQYLMIGEADSGVCGQPWATWAASPFDLPLPADALARAPFTLEKFRRAGSIKEIGRVQICKNDASALNGVSQAVAFRRDA